MIDNINCGDDPDDNTGGISMGSHRLNFEKFILGPEFEERALKELRETPEVVKKAIEELKELIINERDRGFCMSVEDEDRLIAFLRPCKYYAQSSFDRMKKFYKFQTRTKYYKNLLPSLERSGYDQSLISVLPYRNKNGERILLVEAGKKWNTKNCSLFGVFRCLMLVLEMALMEPRTQVCGVQVVLDMDGLSLSHVWQFTPAFAKHVVEWVQDCIPIRMKGVHIVNQPYIFNMLFAIFKPFLGEKLQKRIHFHGSNFDNLHQYIDRSSLPVQFDGELDLPANLGPLLHRHISKYEEMFRERSREGYKKVGL